MFKATLVPQETIRVSLRPTDTFQVQVSDVSEENSVLFKKQNVGALSLKVVATDGRIVPSTQADAVTVTSAATIATSTSRLDNLQDVVEGSPVDGSTLVYDEPTDTYVVQELDLDGGTF